MPRAAGFGGVVLAGHNKDGLDAVVDDLRRASLADESLEGRGSRLT
jgi:hypothetical protein